MTYFIEGVSKHLEPQPEVRRLGEYETVAEAIAAAQKAIEQFLCGEFKRGMSAKSNLRRLFIPLPPICRPLCSLTPRTADWRVSAGARVLFAANVRFWLWIQPIDATHWLNRSAGVS